MIVAAEPGATLRLLHQQDERERGGDRIYHYAVHEVREGGRRRRVRHYLGPTAYQAGVVAHEEVGLVLEGAAEPDPRRLREYLEGVLGTISRRSGEFLPEDLEAIRDGLSRTLTEL
jgi:hypothetical protein